MCPDEMGHVLDMEKKKTILRSGSFGGREKGGE